MGEPGTGQDLLRACRQGDEKAWEALVRKYRHLVYSIPHRIGLGAEDAADVFQTVFLNLLRHVDDLWQEETLVPWLVTTTQRECWKVGRALAKRARGRDELDNDLAAAPPSESGLEEIEKQLAVRGALDRLDARCRRLLTMLFYSDPPAAYSDVSREMKMPVPSIGPTRIRCLEKLKRELKRTGAL